MWFEQLLFYIFSIVLIFSSIMVISLRNPVHSALYLVLAFFASAALWMLLEAEFLALILILVYVGAVMTLFLFVVMMLNLDIAPRRATFVRYLPFAVFLAIMIIALMIYVLGPQNFGLSQIPTPPHQIASYSNVNSLGLVLYTYYVYPFELAAVLLLIAIIAAITLSHRKARRKTQNIKDQLMVNPKDRVKLVK